MNDIHNVVYAGKEVTISERQIRAFGWNGTGYIVLDPDTGVGGYLIDGGKNGGFAFAIGVMIGYLLTLIAISIFSSGAGAAAVTAITANPAALVGLISIILPTLVVFGVFLYNIRNNQTAKQCLRAGILMGLTLRGTFDLTLKDATGKAIALALASIGFSIPDISPDCYKF